MIPIRSKRAFTIIELLIAIVVFSLGLVSAYSLLRTATFLSDRSSDEIVGGNLMRERLELVKNVRDSNWLWLRKWNSLRVGANVSSDEAGFCGNPDDCFLTPGHYLIENDFSDAANPVKFHRLSAAPTKADIIAEVNAVSGTKYRLCLDSKGRYVHDCASGTRTRYFDYVTVAPLNAKTAADSGTAPVDGALAITAHFVSVAAGYREFSMSTVITDWKR